MKRTLANCPAVIFIAYTVPGDAEARGYSPWLVAVDNPFFNAIPGTRHYANWRIDRMERGAAPIWDYVDFQGLESRADLERVWFNPDLDGFRAEWLRLWGYAARNPDPVLRHSYLMRQVSARPDATPGPAMDLRAGRGTPPADLQADIVLVLEGVLKKHFSAPGTPRPDDWLTPAGSDNPLGFDWLAVTYGPARTEGPGDLVASARLIAEPAP